MRRIAFAFSPLGQDVLLSTVVNGLNNLGYTVYGNNNSNYCIGVPYEKWAECAKYSEFILFGNYDATRQWGNLYTQQKEFAEKIKLWDRSIFLDGFELENHYDEYYGILCNKVCDLI